MASQLSIHRKLELRIFLTATQLSISENTHIVIIAHNYKPILSIREPCDRCDSTASQKTDVKQRLPWYRLKLVEFLVKQLREPPIRSRYARLLVLVPPEPPKILKGPVLQAVEDREVNLECISVGGKPAAEVCASTATKKTPSQSDAHVSSSKYRRPSLQSCYYQTTGKVYFYKISYV
ncbi:hypothetical protein SFRURICE_011643 [Spodoptera frugiperda]|nr:hypothetical protein SFRURICE_011643 [Spodoptera frugiperda]